MEHNEYFGPATSHEMVEGVTASEWSAYESVVTAVRQLSPEAYMAFYGASAELIHSLATSYPDISGQHVVLSHAIGGSGISPGSKFESFDYPGGEVTQFLSQFGISVPDVEGAAPETGDEQKEA